MLEIRNRKTLQSKIKVCKSDVKIGDCPHSLTYMGNVAKTGQHSRVDCGCLIKSKNDQVKSKNTMKLRTRIIEIVR